MQASANSGHRLGRAFLAAALLSSFAAQTHGDEPAVPAREPVSDMTRLARGEILLQIVHEEKSGGAARVMALFHADADAVWNIIGYCKYAYIYLKGLRLCQVLKPGLYETRMRHVIKNSWYAPTLDYTFDASRSGGRKGEFHLADGNLKVLEGRWAIAQLPADEGLIVSQEIRIQPRIPTPKWLVRRSLRRDLPDMLACIRGLARASGNTARIESDLVRCPGDVKSAGE